MQDRRSLYVRLSGSDLRFGASSVSVSRMLGEQLKEIRTLAVLEDIQNDERFDAAAGQTAEDAARSRRHLAEHIMETLNGLP